MGQVNVRQLFEDKQQLLQLSHVAGADGVDRIIDSDNVNASNDELIDHLNLIHPNWVQVLSETELDYLRNLSAEERAGAFRQIEQSVTTCLIVAGADDIPAELIAFADQSIFRYSARPTQRAPDVAGPPLSRQELAESTTRHGVFLDVLGVGVIITGESAVGKKRTRPGVDYARQRAGCRRHRQLYRIAPDTLEGSCPELLRDFLEVRGLGVLNIRTMFGETAVRRKKSLKLIVNLHRPQGGDLSQMERLPLNATHQEILGVNINTVNIPVVAGRNLAVLVEAAARNFVMQQRGINSMDEFIERHDQLLLGD